MMLKVDGHVHTPFCPHGSKDEMETYVKRAIDLGIEEISFTEHAPLPPSFSDPAPTKDSSMKTKDISAYLQEGKWLKEKYKQEVKINIGFEVDYIHAYRQEIKAFLDNWGEEIDDAILSVHMLPANGEYICMDYSADEYGRLIKSLGSIEKVHELYYKTVEQSIQANLGKYKPKRIGHITLANKFIKKYPQAECHMSLLPHLLNLMKEEGLELDANTAGWYKPDCGESYPPFKIIQLAKEKEIKIVAGSDSHKAAHIGRGFEKLNI